MSSTRRGMKTTDSVSTAYATPKATTGG
jgi:hypothetical protein